MKKLLFIMAIAACATPNMARANADVLDGVLEKACPKDTSLKFLGFYSGITEAEIAKLSSAPITRPDHVGNPAARIELDGNWEVAWSNKARNTPEEATTPIYDFQFLAKTLPGEIARDGTTKYTKSAWDFVDGVIEKIGRNPDTFNFQPEGVRIIYGTSPETTSQLFADFLVTCYREAPQENLSEFYNLTSALQTPRGSTIKRGLDSALKLCPEATNIWYDYLAELNTAQFELNAQAKTASLKCPAKNNLNELKFKLSK